MDPRQQQLALLQNDLKKVLESDFGAISEVIEEKKVAKGSTFSADESAQYFSESNDNFDGVLSILEKTEPTLDKKLLNIALLIGPAHIPSCLPEISAHANVICIADINPRVFKWIEFYMECLEKSENIDQFYRVYLSKNNPNFKEEADWIEKEKSRLTKNSLINLGKEFFLSSEERFLLCKEAAKKVSFIFVTANLFDQAQCIKLNKIFNKEGLSRLTILNITNILDYSKDDKSSVQAINSFIGKSKPICIFSYTLDPSQPLRAKVFLTPQLFIPALLALRGEKQNALQDRKKEALLARETRQEAIAKEKIESIKSKISTTNWSETLPYFFSPSITVNSIKIKVPFHVLNIWQIIKEAEDKKINYITALNNIEDLVLAVIKKNSSLNKQNPLIIGLESLFSDELFENDRIRYNFSSTRRHG